MKSMISIVLGMIVSITLHAQWTNGTPDINNTNTGNVGIGTITPASKLDVNGDVRSTQKFIITGKGAFDTQSNNILLYANNSLLFSGGGGSTNHLTILSTGNIGVGTATPSSKFEVNGDVRSTGKYIITNAGTFEAQTNNIFISSNNDLRLAAGGASVPHLTVVGANGRVGINATNITHRLTVGGGIGAQEVTVTSTMGADYVFNDDYDLKPLDEVEKFIKENNHLPNVAAAKEMETNGIELGKMDMKLLEKIEELTLYMIELKKEVAKVSDENKVLKQEIGELKKK